MSFWSWLKPEQRETSESYAEQVAAALLDAASGSSDLSQSVAAVEIAAGLWSRGFASARVEPNPYGLLTPALLAWIGREVCLQGEAVGLLEVTDRGLMLYPAVVDEISGTADPATWRYKLDIPGPSTTRTITREASAVVHIRYGATSGAPWAGVAPWEAAEVSASLLSNLEGRLRQEARGRTGYVLPVPVDPADADDDDDDALAGIKTTLKGIKGDLALVETLAGGYGDKGSAPAEDWRPRRLGANPPAILETMIDAATYRLLAACGIPPALVRPGADGTASREAWRQLLHSTLAPVARLAESELSSKLERPVALDFEALFASDISGRARSFASLVNAGLDPDKAASLAGLLDD